MSDPDLVDRLSAHRTLGTVPRNELEWLATHGELRHYAAGHVLAKRGDSPVDMFVMLEGGGGVYIDRGGAPRKVTDWQPGDVTAVLPFSRMNLAIGDAIIEQPTVTLALHRDHFPEMIRECPEVTARLVHAMLDRVRHFASTDWQDDKMMSLGRLAAGLSHELNNPASAATRSAQQLGDALAQVDAAASALAGAQLTDDQRARVEAVRARVDGCDGGLVGALTPLERSDREEEICSWLEDHGADASHAAVLAESGITRDVLDDLSSALPMEKLDIAVRWIAAGHTARALATDVERATRRIYELVSAVKRFTYMDRPTVAEPSSIAQPIADTVTVLGAKARAKTASITVDIPADLPLVNVFGAELNQVWSNLLENALDSIGDCGHVIVNARREYDTVVVRVVDDGPGIPTENLSRIFDPFFTTKAVGQGTGLGLDIARRIVRRHNGHIDVDSRPDGRRTEFRVTLPAL